MSSQEYLSKLIGKTVQSVETKERYSPNETTDITIVFTDGSSLVMGSDSCGYGGETEISFTLFDPAGLVVMIG